MAGDFANGPLLSLEFIRTQEYDEIPGPLSNAIWSVFKVPVLIGTEK